MRRLVPLALLAAACAHAPPPNFAPGRAWPDPPATARVRVLGSFPDDKVRHGSGWRRFLDALVGAEVHESRAGLIRPFGIAASATEVFVADPDAALVLAFDWRRGSSRRLECSSRPWDAPMSVALEGESVFVADAAGFVANLARGRCTLIGEGALERPSGVAVQTGRIYVADPPRHQVVVFDESGREVRRIGSRGEGPGQFNFPTSVAVESDGGIAVVDALNFRLVRFDREGNHLNAFGEPGDVEGTFGRPKGVAAADGSIFVTDAHHDVVLVFTVAGRFEYVFGGPGSGPGELAVPAGIVVRDRFVFVANSENRRVEVFELMGGRS